MKYSKLIPLLFILSTCTPAEKTIQEDFTDLLAGKFAEDEPGGIVLVQKGDEVVFLQGYGVADTGTKEKITETTIFNTGSISKTFVANAILMLVEAGRLSVTDSIYAYFPDFDNEAIAKKIRIEHLLSHTSGLPDLRPVATQEEFYLTAKDQENFEPIKRADTLLFEPGEKFDYSNPAFNGLALIIEQVTNAKWQDFVKERIFKPAGMEHSRITDGSYPDQGVAHAYIKDNGIYQEYDYGEYPTFAAAGNGGVWCSVLDLAKYETAIRNHVFLSKKAIDRSRTVFHPKNWADTIPPGVGYSWFIEDKDASGNEFGVKIVSHTGSQGGFRAFLISVPEKDIIYAGLFNRPVENLSELRKNGLGILKEHNWLE